MRTAKTPTTFRAATLALALLAAALLAACGSSSKTTSTNTLAASPTATASSTPAHTASTPTAPSSTSTKSSSPPAKTSSTPTKSSSTPLPSAPAAAGARFTALRECLAKQGVKLPQSGVRLPAGVSRSQFNAALEKCGGSRAHFFGGGAKGYSSAFKKALANYAACMRQNGINMPAPNTSGKGPIFNTSGLDTTSPAFRAAAQKCTPHLRVARPGAAK